MCVINSLRGLALVGLLGCFEPPRPHFAFANDNEKRLSRNDFPKDSPQKNSAIHLSAVRGETLGLQLWTFDDSPHKVNLQFASEEISVKAFWVKQVSVRETSTTMYGPSLGRGKYPDVLETLPLPSKVAGDWFFDITVRQNSAATAQTLVGVCTIDDQTIPVFLRIEPASIDVDAEPWLWVWYHPGDLAKAMGEPPNTEPVLASEQRYAEMFREHGAYLAADVPPQEFAIRESWMTRGIKYVPLGIDMDADLAAQLRHWDEIFAASDQVGFVVPIDEPATLLARMRVGALGKFMKHQATRVRLAVTAPPAEEFADVVDIFLSPDMFPPARLRSDQKAWTYNGRPPQAGSMIVDTDATALMTWGWIGFRYNVELWHAWQGLYFIDRYNGRKNVTDFDTSVLSFDMRPKGGDDWGNGDGVLIYPGFRPSLRLKFLRRGLQDRLLLEKLQRCGGTGFARFWAESMIPRALGEAGNKPSWPRDPSRWQQSRDVLRQLVGHFCQQGEAQ